MRNLIAFVAAMVSLRFAYHTHATLSLFSQQKKVGELRVNNWKDGELLAANGLDKLKANTPNMTLCSRKRMNNYVCASQHCPPALHVFSILYDHGRTGYHSSCDDDYVYFCGCLSRDGDLNFLEAQHLIYFCFWCAF